MKKTIFLVIIFTMAISLGGCLKKKTITQNDSKVSQYATMMDWLKSGKGVECTVKAPEGDMKIMKKNKNVRIEGIPYVDMSGTVSPNETSDAPQTGIMLNTEDWVYTWSKDKGTKMDIEKMNATSGEEEIDKDDYSWKTWANDQEDMDMNYECKEANLSDDLFKEPKDVEFTDLTVMMEGTQNLGEDIINDMGGPSEVPGFDGSQGMNQEDIEARIQQMMKKNEDVQ